MSLQAGTRLGPYEIAAAIGAGGMGEVYRARDTALDRDVALKILPDAFASDPERLARFEREAKTLAVLNHPNIAAIYGLESSGPIRALVMELVPGPTLADVLDAEGALAPDAAIHIARQVAEALEAAHEAGIMHRDLKPANIKRRDDHVVKLLDFGLARAIDSDAAAGPAGPTTSRLTVLSPAVTQQGVILGTAGYMSPEQARGRTADRRADIWAFGVVLYEMLVGRRLFAGDTVTEVIASVIKDAPRLEALPATTPPAIRRLLARCLERDPKRRLRDIGEARVVLESPSALDEPVAAPAAANSPGQRRTWLWVASIAGALAIGAAASRWVMPAAADLPARQFAIATPDRMRATQAVMSPDGRSMAFATAGKSWVMPLDLGAAIEIPGAAGARALFWSADSTQIGYQLRGHLWRVPASGGTPVDIGVVPRDFSPSGGAVWLPDDRILYLTGGSGLMEVSAHGGPSRPALEADPKLELDFHEPSALPDGKGVLFVPHLIAAPSVTSIDVFDGRARRQVFQSPGIIRQPAYSSTGHLLFTRGGGAWAVAFDLATYRTSGEPFLVATDSSRPTVSADGTLLLVPEGASTDQQLTWADRSGQVTTALGRGGLSLRGPRLSPDGRQSWPP